MPESPYKAWLAKAANDYLAIQNNVNAADVPWDVVCFHAQQCAEKILKAYLVLDGRTPQRTHDLTAVLMQCADITPGLVDLEDDCLSLTTLAIGPRYPDPFYDPREDEAREAIAALERIRARLLPLFPATGP
jgi:HEPN domain-containing protein